MNTWNFDIHLDYFTFTVLSQVEENLNQHPCENYVHLSIAIIGWLWIQEVRTKSTKALCDN